MNKKITGVMFYYYFVCKRKLWCFANGIQLENEDEDELLEGLLMKTVIPERINTL